MGLKKLIKKILIFSLIISLPLLAGCSPNSNIEKSKVQSVDELESGYVIFNDAVYYTHPSCFGKYCPSLSGESIKLGNADIKTFRSLGDGYGLDKNHVYYHSHILEDADPQTFRKLYGNTTYYSYYADKSHVYLRGSIVQYADPETFKRLDGVLLEGLDYAVDKNYVFYHGIRIEDADPQTFKLLAVSDRLSVYDSNYAIDKNHVYCARAIVKDADPESFRILGYHYSADKNNVFSNWQPPFCYNITKMSTDADSFKVLSGFYASDKNKVYWQGKIVEDADPATFQAFDELFGKDKNFNFYMDKKRE